MKQVSCETIKDFVARLFDGEALPLVEHLIHDRGLKADEIERLRTMLDEIEESEQAPGSKKKRRK